MSAGLVAGARDIILCFSGSVMISFGGTVICERWAGGGNPGHCDELKWLCLDRLRFELYCNL